MTVGLTTISTAKILEHAFRRAGISVEKQTPDLVQLAKENLFFLFAYYSNKGLPLWCVEEFMLPVNVGQYRYECPTGTVDLLSANLRSITRASTTDTVSLTGVSSEFLEETAPKVVGITCDSDVQLNLIIEHSSDGATWSHSMGPISCQIVAGEEYWISITKNTSATHHRVRETVLTDASFSSVRWISSYTDRLLTRMSRDQYFVLPNKHSSGTPSQYWMDRQITPAFNLWPVPSSSSYLVHAVRQRQIQDVTRLTETLDIPVRWHEATIWQLAARMVVSIPETDPTIREMVLRLAEQHIIVAETEDVDDAPMFVQPDISVYTS